MRQKNLLMQWRLLSYNRKPIPFSHVFRTCEPIPKERLSTPSICKSNKLMLNQGLISPSSPGIFRLMPLCLRSLEKLSNLIDIMMAEVNGQKMILPSLVPVTLWVKSGRWSGASDLFKLNDRHKTDYCLGPTHEEVATSMLTNMRLSFKSFPLRLYQVSSKYRDEVNPKLGLLRAREFIMKDMYTFDANAEDSLTTYEEICSTYSTLFKLLDIDFYKVKGSSGDMGGSHSHEFHFLSEVGEDEILVCKTCKSGYNVEVAGDKISCENCGSQLDRRNGIEVGHAFLLGQTYTKTFEVRYNSGGGHHIVPEMGCYGLGVSRILAACIECLSMTKNIRWPLLISPFLVSVIPPKRGSKEAAAEVFAKHFSESLCEIEHLSGNVLWDDRKSFTIGKRIEEATILGIPYMVIASGPALENVPKIEVLDVYKNETTMMTHKEAMDFFRGLSLKLLHKMASCTKN